jgi:hypothetical protein
MGFWVAGGGFFSVAGKKVSFDMGLCKPNWTFACFG